MALVIFSPGICPQIVMSLVILKWRQGEGETGRELLVSLGPTSELRLSSLFRGSRGRRERLGGRGAHHWWGWGSLLCTARKLLKQTVLRFMSWTVFKKWALPPTPTPSPSVITVFEIYFLGGPWQPEFGSFQGSVLLNSLFPLPLLSLGLWGLRALPHWEREHVNSSWNCWAAGFPDSCKLPQNRNNHGVGLSSIVKPNQNQTKNQNNYQRQKTNGNNSHL